MPPDLRDRSFLRDRGTGGMCGGGGGGGGAPKQMKKKGWGGGGGKGEKSDKKVA